MESFLNRAHALAVKCNFRASHKEIISTLFAVRISDSEISQRLKMQNDISLRAVPDIADRSAVVEAAELGFAS